MKFFNIPGNWGMVRELLGVMKLGRFSSVYSSAYSIAAKTFVLPVDACQESSRSLVNSFLRIKFDTEYVSISSMDYMVFISGWRVAL